MPDFASFRYAIWPLYADSPCFVSTPKQLEARELAMQAREREARDRVEHDQAMYFQLTIVLREKQEAEKGMSVDAECVGEQTVFSDKDIRDYSAELDARGRRVDAANRAIDAFLARVTPIRAYNATLMATR